MASQLSSFNELGNFLFDNYAEKIKLDKEAYISIIQEFAKTQQGETIQEVLKDGGLLLEAKILSKKLLNLLSEYLLTNCKERIPIKKEDLITIFMDFEKKTTNSKSNGHLISISDEKSGIEEEKNIEDEKPVAVQLKRTKRSKNVSKELKKSFVTDKKLQKIEEVLEKKNKTQLELIEKYQKFKSSLGKNMQNESSNEDEDDSGTDTENKKGNQLEQSKRFPCFEDLCGRRYYYAFEQYRNTSAKIHLKQYQYFCCYFYMIEEERFQTVYEALTDSQYIWYFDGNTTQKKIIEKNTK